VPFAEAERRIALLAEHLGDVAELVWEAGAEVRHGPHADGMLGSAGEQRRPGRRAQRRHVEVVELQSFRGQRVDVWGVDVGAVAPELRKAGVVEQDHHYVGCTGPGMRGLVEPWLRVGQGAADGSVESGRSGHPVMVLLPSGSAGGQPAINTRSANRHDRLICRGERRWVLVISSNASGEVSESSRDSRSEASATVRPAISARKHSRVCAASAARLYATASAIVSWSSAQQAANPMMEQMIAAKIGPQGEQEITQVANTCQNY